MMRTSGTSSCSSPRTRSPSPRTTLVASAPLPHLLGNLQGVTGHRGFRKGIRSGEGWKREVAAFMLDRSRLFSVPTTAQAFFTLFLDP